MLNTELYCDGCGKAAQIFLLNREESVLFSRCEECGFFGVSEQPEMSIFVETEEGSIYRHVQITREEALTYLILNS